MADEATNQPAEAQEQDTVEEQRVPYERFQQANKKAKEAGDRAKALEARLAELERAAEERESAGLPELDRERKAREAAEKRLEAAEKRAAEQESRIEMSRRERLVASAASDAKVKYPNLLVKDIDLDSIENDADAKRAVKDAVKKYPDLVQSQRPDLPGRVLENGRPTASPDDPAFRESTQIAADLAEFRATRSR